jgi:hypothetical protein
MELDTSKKDDFRLSGKLNKFSTTLLLTSRADSLVNMVKTHQEVDMSKHGLKS